MELYGVAPCLTATHVSGTTRPTATQIDGDAIARYAIRTARTTDNTARQVMSNIATCARS